MGKKKIEFRKKNKKEVGNQNCIINDNEIDVECQKLLRITTDPVQSNQLWENYLEISNTLDKIRKLEENEKFLPKRTDAIDTFLTWLRNNGAKINGVSIHEFPDYDLGLRADSDFNENDLILEIPRNLIFNVNTAANEIKDLQTDVLIQFMPQVELAIALLIERYKADSIWKPYLNMLPRKYNTILYMTINDMMDLKGSLSLENTVKQYRNIARQYAYFRKVFSTSKCSVTTLLRYYFTYEDYRWAVSTVMTRQNVIPNEDDTQILHSLIPMWDMCNHEEGKITTDFNPYSNSCRCYAMRNFKSGDQIFIYYGPRTNSEFFIHSGFVYLDNKNDGFKLQLGISKVDPLWKEKIELLTKLDLMPVHEYLLKPNQELIPESLLGFLRIFHMDKYHLDYWLKSSNVYGILEKTNGTSDTKIYEFLIVRLNLLLSGYKRSEQEDFEEKDIMSPAKKLILQLKTCEEKLLREMISSLQLLKSIQVLQIQ